MKYCKYSYLYGTRPENAINPNELDSWDNKNLIVQPKIDGSNCLIFSNFEETHIMNRHREPLSNFKLSSDEIKSIFRGTKGNWIVINGEYTNKNKNDESGKPFNHKLVIFDILVANSEHLIGKNFQDRIDFMDFIYETKNSEKDYLYKISDNIYRVKSYDSGFKNLYDKLTKIDICEGLVLKKKSQRLELGISPSSRGLLKCRRATKNFKY